VAAVSGAKELAALRVTEERGCGDDVFAS